MATKRTYESPDLAAAIERMARALVRRAAEGDLEALSALAACRVAVDRATVDAARAAHDGPFRYSWTEIGVELDVSRQAARQRFGG